MHDCMYDAVDEDEEAGELVKVDVMIERQEGGGATRT